MNIATRLPFDEKHVTLDLIAGDLAFKPFYCLINEFAKKAPNNIAVKFDNTCWTYQKLVETANKLAKLLVHNGIKKGDIVALAVDRSAEMIAALLAILKSGATYVPLDPSYPKDRIEFMLSDAAATILLTSKKYRGYFAANATELLIEDAWAMLDKFGPAELKINISGDDTAYILYTSGSTGKPKGVIISHQNLANFLLSMQKKPGISAGDRLLAISTISFDIAGLEMYLPLISGACIVLASTETAKDGWLLLELMKKEKISIMQATPYTWRMLISAGWEEFIPVRIITGGEPLPKDLAGQLLQRCSEVWNQYGPTETTVYSTQKQITGAAEITIGSPVDNTSVYVLDELMHKQPVGLEGELYIGGAGVAKGYLNRPELTAAKFVDDPFSRRAGAKMYRTGDLGCIMPNGEIQCLGRIDQQVKVRGFRIEPGEIEYALLQAEGVREAVVTVRTDTGDARIIAYLVTAGSHNPEVLKMELKPSLSAQLPAYMVPDDFVFIPAVPVMPNGKIDRNALPSPEPGSREQTKAYAAPKTKFEKQLVKIWEDLMNKPLVGINDNFFELGGHSLVAVQIMARLQKITGKRHPIATLLKYPTVAALALYLKSGEDDSAGLSSLVGIKAGGTKKPLYIIHGEGLNVLYFNDLATNMDQEQPVYGLQARGLKGDAPLDVMEEIAASYVLEILAADPVGPYFLAGYSFGGYVAVEMRKQMSAMGKDVALIIFDTDAEKSEYKSLSYLIPRKVKRHFPLVISKIGSALADPGSILQNIQKKVAAKRSAKDAEEYYLQIKKIKAKLRTALRNYVIEPFDDKVYLYKAKVCTHYVDDTEFLGWGKFARKGVEICEVSGDHLSMLLHPYVEDFAVKLQRGVNRLAMLQTNNDLQLS